MRARKFTKPLKALLEVSPAVILTGARQCGKTTVAKSLGGHYFDLEKSVDQTRLEAQWETLIQSKDLIVLDEAQEYPAIFKALRPAIDEDRHRNGRFLILGSVAPSLMVQVGESLAGRVSLLEMTPFLYPEIKPTETDRLWRAGGYPDGGVLSPKSFGRWQESYLSLLAQRDLPLWGLPAKPQMTQRLFKMLAVNHAQLLNLSELGSSLGITYKTVSSYLDFLEGAFLIRKLQPIHTNLKKRMVKSPKVYWRDSGLAHNLLGYVSLKDDILSYPWVGASWEGWCIEQIISALKLNQKSFEPYFFRSSDGYEIDLVLESGKSRVAIEIKLTTNPAPEMLKRLEKSSEFVDADTRILLTRQKESVQMNNGTIGSLSHVLKFLVAEKW